MHVNIRLSNVSLHLIVNLQGLSDQNEEINVANFPTHLEAWKPNVNVYDFLIFTGFPWAWDPW